MDPRYSQANAPDAFNAYHLYAQHNAAATLNRNNQELSASAPEFIPNFKPTPSSISGDWNYQAHHQDTSQLYQQPQQIYPQQNHSRPFQQQQQFQRNYQGYSGQQHQSNRNFRPDLIQNHHPSFSNQQQQQQQQAQPQHHSSQQQQQQHFMMMNQQQSHHNFPQQGGHGGSHGGSSTSGGHGDGMGNSGMRGGNIQNRLNFNNSHQPESVVAHEPTPHKQTETEQVALDYLGEMVAKLNDNPGLFENYQKKLREMFLELANNHFVMSNAIETIFEQSINEQNFRYTGARLCLLFDSLDLSPASTFRNLLLMKMDFQNTEQIPFMQNEQRRVRGSTLFLAELFVQLKRPEDTRSAVDVSRYVLNSIMLLLTKSGPENVKCVCQSLKLSGYDLQKENPTDVEEAINQLKTIAEEQNIQTKRLIQSVVDLFYDNWGRKDAVEIENQPPSLASDHLPAHLQNQQYTDSPVFYGPDGQIISEEESSFLNSNMPENYPINIDDIIDDDSDDLVDEEDEPEMDLEMQMAYKEFIKGGKDKKSE